MKIQNVIKIFKHRVPLLAGALALLATPNVEAQTTPGPQPNICARSCWAARAPNCGVTTMPALTRAIVHHTASASDWSTTSIETSKPKIRGVQNYHMDANGWCDIGYHFLFDKLGNIFEGRVDSMTTLRRGIHDACNGNSFGFTLLGYFHPPYNHSPTPEMLNSYYNTIAWRMPAGWSPYGAGTYCSKTVGFLDGHKKVVATACPGDSVHPNLITENYNGGPMRTGVAQRRTPGFTSAITLNGAVSYNQDGRMQVFAVAANGNLYTSGQTANNQSTWSTWLNMGGNWPGRTAAVATNLDGRIQVFLVGTDGSLYTCSQTGPNQGAWTGWQSMGGTWTGKDAVFGYNQDGRMQVFLIGTDYGGSGKLYTSGQTVNNQSTWSSWLSVGGNWPNDRVPAVGRNLDGRLQVFLVGTDYGSQGYLWTSAQTGPNQGAWTAWQSMGGNWPNKRAVVGNNQDGRMQVFLVGTDFGGSGYLYTSGQTANNQSSWSSWLSVGGNWPTGRIPAVSRNLDGRIQVFLVGTDFGSTGYIWTSAQTGPNQGAWTGWSSMGGNWPVNPFVGKNADGRMQVFCIGNGHEMDTSGQTANNQNTWSGWLNMGGYWPAF